MLKTATVVDDSSKSDEVGMDDIVEVEFEVQSNRADSSGSADHT